MMDEEIKELVNEFNRKVSLDPEIRSVMQKIRNQDADFSDTSRMFWRRSELLRDYLQGIVLDLPAGAREQLCTALLNAGYNETNEVMQSVQQVQDEPQGIHLNPVLPKCPAERIHTVAHALEDPTVPDDKIVRRAGAPVANVQMSFHDRYIEENAKIRAKLGMKPTITRYGSGCCAWCSAVAGRYRFGDQPKDVFRRHDNCDCIIIYDNQVLRGRETSSGRSKTWEEVDPKSVEALGFTPTVHTQEQAKKLQENALEQLTKPEQGDMIFTRASQPNRKIGSDGQQVVDKPTFNKITRDFTRRGGLIISDDEAVQYLHARKAHAAYLPSFNTILVTPEPTVSEILEETYHAEQDRLHMYGDMVTDEVRLRREIDAQKYLLSVTERYKIPDDEVELTKHNLADYEQQLKDLLELQEAG